VIAAPHAGIILATRLSWSRILPPLAGGLFWNTQNLYTSGIIAIVPATASLLAVGFASVLVARRRNRRSLQD
jgi:hypothetical protein